MEVETIIAIVTAGIALITSVVSFSYNLIQNRKSRVQKIVLENRIKYLDAIRAGHSKLIGCADIGAIKAALKSSEASKAFYANLFEGYGKINSYIKPFYDIDGALLDSLDKLYSHILAIINGESNDAELLKQYRNEYADRYAKYDWAYWRYIQAQKSGDYINSDDAFDNIYYEFVKGLDEKNKQ